jgi:hypothetical protein
VETTRLAVSFVPRMAQASVRREKEIPMRDLKGFVRFGRLSIFTALSVLVCAAGTAWAGTINYEYDFLGYDCASAAMETTFGTKIAELDAEAYGFDFSDGDPSSGLRNLNVISQVFVATQTVNLGTCVRGKEIVLNPGDYTFAYTLDYSVLEGLAANSDIWNFQLYRVIQDDFINYISNPGPFMALAEIDDKGGAYNTNAEFGSGAGTPPLLVGDDLASPPIPHGLTGEEIDMDIGGSLFQSSEVEFSWDANDLIDPGMKAMVLVFTGPDVELWQIGWGSQSGQSLPTLAERQAVGETGEGANVIGGAGSQLDNIPVIVPVVPEPGMVLLISCGVFLLRRRR